MSEDEALWFKAEILAQAEPLMGSRQAAEQWLAQPAMALGFRCPRDLMATRAGAEQVLILLNQLDGGVYV